YRPLRRGESDPGEMGARRNGPDPARDPAAADAAVGRAPRSRARGVEALWSDELTKTSGSMTAARRLRPFAIALLAAALGACAIGERIDEASKIDYKSSTKGPSLDVPPDLAAPSADGRYVVPERAARTASAYESSRAAERSAAAAPTAVLPRVEGARIERDGSQRWLVVDLPPERVWPVVRDFWRESGLGVKTESPETGIIETEWAENRAKLPLDFIRRTIG